MSEELEQEIEVLRAIYQDELSGSASSGLILDVRPTPRLAGALRAKADLHLLHLSTLKLCQL